LGVGVPHRGERSGGELCLFTFERAGGESWGSLLRGWCPRGLKIPDGCGGGWGSTESKRRGGGDDDKFALRGILVGSRGWSPSGSKLGDYYPGGVWELLGGSLAPPKTLGEKKSVRNAGRGNWGGVVRSFSGEKDGYLEP